MIYKSYLTLYTLVGGRGVGYTSGEETFDEKITDISATKIRKSLGIE